MLVLELEKPCLWRFIIFFRLMIWIIQKFDTIIIQKSIFACIIHHREASIVLVFMKNFIILRVYLYIIKKRLRSVRVVGGKAWCSRPRPLMEKRSFGCRTYKVFDSRLKRVCYLFIYWTYALWVKTGQSDWIWKWNLFMGSL